MEDNPNPLFEYFIKNSTHQIHKWVDYFEAYHDQFSAFRGRAPKVLEIGIQNGGSARMWRSYFGEGTEVVGVDIDKDCKKLEDEGIEIWIGDQADPKFWESVLAKHSYFDIIIDDGGHTMKQQIVSFECLFPHVSDGGIYLCEDTHTSYYPAYGGGAGRKGTFIEYVKDLIDKMHGWHHYPLERLNKDGYFARNILSINIYDSIVSIKKRLKNPPLALARGYNAHRKNPAALSFLDVRKASGVPD